MEEPASAGILARDFPGRGRQLLEVRPKLRQGGRLHGKGVALPAERGRSRVFWRTNFLRAASYRGAPYHSARTPSTVIVWPSASLEVVPSLEVRRPSLRTRLPSYMPIVSSGDLS
jgi:hypothetical protein